MPSTFTNNGGIELPADGEKDGVWGDVVNLNMQIVDRLTNGVGFISLSGTTHTLTTTNGTLSDGQYGLLVFGGSPTGANTVTILPNDAEKVYLVRNTTAQSVIMTQGSGSNVTIPAGAGAIVYANGTGTGAAVADLTTTFVPNLTDGEFTGPVTLSASSSSAVLNITQTGSGNALTVEDSSSPDSSPFVVTSAGRVGVGSVAPVSPLHVISAEIPQFAVGESGTAQRLSVSYSTTPTATSVGSKIEADGIGVNYFLRDGFSGSHIFHTGTTSTERMRINALGNVGIGTASPAYKLDVNGTIATTSLRLGGSDLTATAAELNLLDGVTASTAELNLLDGVTATTTEINYIDGVTSAIQTQLDGKYEAATQTDVAWEAGTSTTESLVSPVKVKAAIEALAISPIKAWVNFNGTGTVTIRDSLNVSSITDNGVGDYTINFSSPLSGPNYVVLITVAGFDPNRNGVVAGDATNTPLFKTTSSVRIRTGNPNDGSSQNFPDIYVAIIN